MSYVSSGDVYCTHQKYTREELSNLSKTSTVLELGVGNGSSPLMYEFCKNNPDAVVSSFETDANWFEKMFDKYGDLPNYIFNLIEDWSDLKNHIDKNEYDLVFVDQSPWSARIESINLLKDKTKVFILHDYDYFNHNEHDWVKNSPSNIYINDETSWLGQTYSSEFILGDYYEVLPPTLVMKKK
jgi:hypothetical protein